MISDANSRFSAAGLRLSGRALFSGPLQRALARLTFRALACPFKGPTTAVAVLRAGSVRHLQEARLADLLQEDRRRRARRGRRGGVPAAG